MFGAVLALVSMLREPTEIDTPELVLLPLRVEHAAEMQLVLADESLGAFTGDSPPTLPELEARYRRQVAGRSVDENEQWMNWVIVEPTSNRLVGYVQATIQASTNLGSAVAELAWVIGVPWQGRGYATSAAAAVCRWLRAEGVADFAANIHPSNVASERVAERLGLHLTADVVGGERRWASDSVE